MKISAEDVGDRRYRVINRDTGEEIRDVVWVDTETGEYEALAHAADGDFLFVNDDFVVEKGQANIELREIT